MGTGVREAAEGVVAGLLFVPVKDDDIATIVEDTIPRFIKEPCDAIVASLSSYIEVATLQAKWGAEEPGVLRNFWVPLMNFTVPDWAIG